MWDLWRSLFGVLLTAACKVLARGSRSPGAAEARRDVGCGLAASRSWCHSKVARASSQQILSNHTEVVAAPILSCSQSGLSHCRETFDYLVLHQEVGIRGPERGAWVADKGLQNRFSTTVEFQEAKRRARGLGRGRLALGAGRREFTRYHQRGSADDRPGARGLLLTATGPQNSVAHDGSRTPILPSVVCSQAKERERERETELTT